MKSDKSSAARILIFGTDAQLLETRQWLLQSRGYRVTPVADLSAMKLVPVDPPPCLLLLCHSLSPAECDAAIAIAEGRWPAIQHLVLEADSKRNPTGILGQLFHTMDGPARLISQVGKLVGTSSGAPTAP